MADNEKANYEKPRTQVDLEARLENGNASSKVLSTADNAPQAEDDGNGRDYRVEGNETDAYLNVDPMYQNYANDTEAPHLSEEGPEADLEDQLRGEGENEDQPDEGDKPADPAKSTVAKKAAAKPVDGPSDDSKS